MGNDRTAYALPEDVEMACKQNSMHEWLLKVL